MDQFKKILIVEDHPVMRRGLRELIGVQENWTVTGEAEDVEGGLREVAAETPDLAIVDLTLKNSSGIDLIRELKKSYSNVVVVVLTMMNEARREEEALRAGADAYLMKADGAKALLTVMRGLLGNGNG